MITDDFDENFPETIMEMINILRPDERRSAGIDRVLDFLTSPELNTTANQSDSPIHLYRRQSMPNFIIPEPNLENTTSTSTFTLPNTYNAYEHTLTNSFATAEPKFKKVLSQRGEASLKKITYDPSIHTQDMCPITQTTFEPGDELTELPCKHYFENEGIEHWLKHEKAECPVCRMQLDHEELEHHDHDNAREDARDNDRDHDELTLGNERITLFNSLSRISNPHPFGPRRGMEYFVGEQDNDDLQTAIIASLLDI